MNLTGLDPRLRPNVQWLVDVARYYDVPVTVTSTRRSTARQSELYALRQAGKWPYPVAAPGTSPHEFGMAWDSTVPSWAEDWWVQLRRWVGWTVPQNDLIHAQLPNWREYL